MQRTISKNREKRKERCHKMERKLAAIVDEIDETTENILSDENSSCEADGVHEISLFGSTDTRGGCNNDAACGKMKNLAVKTITS